MRAVSPVIATLILIAIAVIAGVFVLRQFLLYTATGRQQILFIQDATFYLAVKTDPTTGIDWISVELQLNLKNIGDRIITITNITVDGKYRVLNFERINLNPGTSQLVSYTVVLNPVTGDTQIEYTPEWERGTQHTVTVYYIVQGTTIEQSAVAKGSVIG